MIKDNITLRINKSNINHFNNLNYNVKIGDIIKPNIMDINKGSHLKIIGICDNCNNEKEMEFRTYYKITNNFKENYYCKKCSHIKNKKTNLEKYGVDLINL